MQCFKKYIPVILVYMLFSNSVFARDWGVKHTNLIGTYLENVRKVSIDNEGKFVFMGTTSDDGSIWYHRNFIKKLNIEGQNLTGVYDYKSVKVYQKRSGSSWNGDQIIELKNKMSLFDFHTGTEYELEVVSKDLALQATSSFSGDTGRRRLIPGTSPDEYLNIYNTNSELGFSYGNFVIEKYKLGSSVPNATFKMLYKYSDLHYAPKNGVALNDGSLLICTTDKTVVILKQTGDTYYISDTIKHPEQAVEYSYEPIIHKFNDAIVICEFNRSGKLLLSKFDMNGNLIKRESTDYSKSALITQTSNAEIGEYTCQKDEKGFFTFVNKDGINMMVEWDSNLNKIEENKIDLPSEISSHAPLKIFLTRMAYNNSNNVLCITYEVLDRNAGDTLTGHIKYSYYTLYKRPPLVTITTPRPNIGDNTMVSIDILASENYPILCVFNETIQQPIYWGTPQNTINYNWNSVGDVKLSARLYESDNSLLSISNTITINQKDVLNQALSIINSQNGLQKIIIIGDNLNRYYTDNIQNQLLVNELKTKSQGIYLITNSLSDVLQPLLK